MYVSAYFLASFCRPEDTNYWDRRCILALGGSSALAKGWVVVGRGGLVVVYTIQTEAKRLHGVRLRLGTPKGGSCGERI
jgi:hypothetical protein